MEKSQTITRQMFQMRQRGFSRLHKSIKKLAKEVGVEIQDISFPPTTGSPERQLFQLETTGFEQIAQTIEQIKLPPPIPPEKPVPPDEVREKAIDDAVKVEIPALKKAGEALSRGLGETQNSLTKIFTNIANDLALLRRVKLSREDFNGLKKELRGKPGETPSDEKLRSLMANLLPEPVDTNKLAADASRVAVEELKPLIPREDSPEEIVNKINSLPPKGSKINASQIEDLPTPVIQQIFVGGQGSTSGQAAVVPRVEDLSSQCNGSTKTYTLSASATAVLMLSGTQFPNTYRPTTDFVFTAPSTITLTSQVGAVETGQTLIALVY